MERKKIQILLGLYNGMPHLTAQLTSISEQSHKNWQLWVGNDGADDGSQEILERFSAAHDQQVTIIPGPQQGATANFLNLLAHPKIPEGAIAFCDQDDIWYPNKLQRSLEALRQASHPIALYCSRTEIGVEPSDSNLFSPIWSRDFGFRNALLQTVAGANTMVLSPRAARLACRTAHGPTPAFHDWWLYLLISGVGGQVIYDHEPSLFYRQHSHNLLGRNRGWAARYARYKAIQNGTYRSWVEQNLAAITVVRDDLTPEAQQILDRFSALRNDTGLRCLSEWVRLGIYRQSRFETALMAAACALGKV